MNIWSQKINLKFNAKKRKVLTITRKKNPVVYDCNLGSDILSRVNEGRASESLFHPNSPGIKTYHKDWCPSFEVFCNFSQTCVASFQECKQKFRPLEQHIHQLNVKSYNGECVKMLLLASKFNCKVRKGMY
jgi:hypothetical protein